MGTWGEGVVMHPRKRVLPWLFNRAETLETGGEFSVLGEIKPNSPLLSLAGCPASRAWGFPPCNLVIL